MVIQRCIFWGFNNYHLGLQSTVLFFNTVMMTKPTARISLYFEGEELSLLSYARQSAKEQRNSLSRYFRDLIRKDLDQKYFAAARTPVGLISEESDA